MRFMILVKSAPSIEAQTTPVAPDTAMMAAMGAFHEELSRAGVLLDFGGLQPSRAGWRVQYLAGGERQVADGPFADASELVAGFTTIEVRSREEALEWSRRYPNPVGEGQAAQIEVRQLYGRGDFAQRKTA